MPARRRATCGILNPYISFADNARQALEFYRDVFGGELALNTFGEYGDPSAPGAELIMHGMLETPDGFTLMGADTPPGMEHSPGDTMSVSLSGDDTDQLRGWWDELAGGRDGRRAAGAADVGRHLRHVHRLVRHPVDGEHRRELTGGRAASGRWPDDGDGLPGPPGRVGGVRDR